MNNPMEKIAFFGTGGAVLGMGASNQREIDRLSELRDLSGDDEVSKKVLNDYINRTQKRKNLSKWVGGTLAGVGALAPLMAGPRGIPVSLASAGLDAAVYGGANYASKMDTGQQYGPFYRDPVELAMDEIDRKKKLMNSVSRK